MKPRSLVRILAAGATIATAGYLAVRSDPPTTSWALQIIFVVTLAIELLALVQAIRARSGFETRDDGRRTWTLIAAFMGIRILAQLRLATLHFDLVPGFIAHDPDAFFVYRVGLRYLYTLSDLVAVVALASAIRTYRAVGLGFVLRPLDYLIATAVALIPTASFALRANLGDSPVDTDLTIVTYRLVAVTVGAVIAGLSLILLRFASLMGGGIMARVWRAAAFAGLARTLSFLALALVAPSSVEDARFLEALLLWGFAGGWLVAASEQRGLWNDG